PAGDGIDALAGDDVDGLRARAVVGAGQGESDAAAGDVVAAGDAGRVAQDRAADHVAVLTGYSDDRRAGLDRGQRFVGLLGRRIRLDGAVVQAVAVVTGRPGVGADLRRRPAGDGIDALAG